LIASGAIDVAILITHEFPFASAPEALERVTTRGSETIGVVLKYAPAEI
jgi:threonine dehydrogenase-like Zn-dependent dehydrogenase